MEFSSINIQGNILSSEILDKIRTEEKFKHQTPEAFGLARSASLRDEIGHAWAIMRTHWQAYKKRLETLPQGDTGTSLTRERLIIPLLAELGYEVSRQKAQHIDGKSYAISHGGVNRDNFPIHIMGYKDNLDKRRESGGPRLSPHALVQEYLNSTEHLFALVTNGKHLRLLRDSTRLVRMSYVEFDLQRMFEEELYADFSILYRVLHSSRMPEKIDAGPDAVIEYYHQESMASGTRIREKLSEAVEESIKTLANGFLSHPKNEALIQLVEDDRIDANTFYTHQLRLIYRILFLIVLEERNLIYPEDPSEEQQRFRDIYYKYYSIERLRKLTENRVYVDADKFDLWESLKTTFLLFEDERYGSKISIKPLGSGLFAYNALGNLKSQFLNNGDLIKVLKHLTTFVDDQNQLVRVNYSDLDVEEFGSVYEGLLEYDPLVEKIGSQYQFSFVEGDGRSSSGSHYTPEELVKPLIKHSLDYIITDKLKEDDPESALLSITVCDVACGSGHILLSAARRIAIELASLREGAEQPSPTYYRAAIRDVIRNCIYGVDLNPLAVELCKVALWLEAHNPNEPLNFLDHHIKNGNAIVGLAHFEELQNGIANEAFKKLPDDNKDIAAEFKKRNALERKTKQISTYDVETADINLQGLQKEFAAFTNMPESTPEEIAKKAKVYEELTKDKKWYRLNNLANLQIAQFFIPKTEANKEKLTTNAKYRTYLNTGAQLQDRGAANFIANEKRFFHWFLEFPEVFSKGGFDCILGNPPYKGGSKLSTIYGDYFKNYIGNYYNGVAGMADLVSYFIRRYQSIIRDFGFLSIITTDKVSEGKTRESSLDYLLKVGCSINSAIKTKKWPGEANVHVSIFSVYKGLWTRPYYLNGEIVSHISSLFSSEMELGNPYKLLDNKGLSYTGTKVYGEGFIIQESQKNQFIQNDPNNAKVIKQFISGDDINSHHPDNWKRWAIDLNAFNIDQAKAYKAPFNHLLQTVFPSRQNLKTDKKAKEYWWKYQRERKELYDKIKDLDEALVMAQTSKHIMIKPISTKNLFSVKCIVFSKYDMNLYNNIQSSFHSLWSWKYGTTMGASTLQYSTTACFDTFPLITVNNVDYAQSFLNYVIQKQENKKCGLTEIFNEINSKESENDFIANELRRLFVKLDESLLHSFGWKDLKLRHDFYEVDYLPENDRIRYTIHPEARKEVLKRLLILNHERYEEEIQRGLHKRKDVVAFYNQKGKEVPKDITCIDDKKPKAKKKANVVKEPKEQYGLFPEASSEVSEGSMVNIKRADGTNFKYHITKNAIKDKFTKESKQIATTSSLAQMMLGKKTGDSFEFGSFEFEIINVE